MKSSIYLGFLVLCIFFSHIANGQQRFKTGKTKGLLSTYIVEGFPSGRVIIYNESNTLINQKPNHNPEQITVAGLNLKGAYKQIQDAIKTSLNSQQLTRLRSQTPIGLTLLVRNNGKIDGVTFQLPDNSPITIQEIEQFEKIITGISIPVKDAGMYKSVNFIPVTMVLRPTS